MNFMKQIHSCKTVKGKYFLYNFSVTNCSRIFYFPDNRCYAKVILAAYIGRPLLTYRSASHIYSRLAQLTHNLSNGTAKFRILTEEEKMEILDAIQNYNKNKSRKKYVHVINELALQFKLAPKQVKQT